MLLSNADFLLQLQQLFQSRVSKGSVFITQKRLSYEAPSEDTVMADAEASGSSAAGGGATAPEESEREWPCLVRATDGESKTAKVKISTVVQPSDYLTFSTSYGALLKSSMSSLRKKKKTKKKPAEAKKSAGATASGKDGASGKGKVAFALTKVVGPRRGAGHAKRLRLKKRREKELKKIWARRKREDESKA